MDYANYYSQVQMQEVILNTFLHDIVTYEGDEDNWWGNQTIDANSKNWYYNKWVITKMRKAPTF